MSTWTAATAIAFCAALGFTGCATTAPASGTPEAATEGEPEAPAIDATDLPPDQLKAVAAWIDYICALPPEKRAEAMKGASAGYMLVTGSGQEGAPKDGPTLAFACPR